MYIERDFEYCYLYLSPIQFIACLFVCRALLCARTICWRDVSEDILICNTACTLGACCAPLRADDDFVHESSDRGDILSIATSDLISATFESDTSYGHFAICC